MNRFLTDMFGSGLQTGRGLRSGEMDDLRWTSWTDVHREARVAAGCLQRSGVRPGSRVAVLALDPKSVAVLSQAVWMTGATLTMLQQPTTQTDLADWRADCLRAMAMLRSDVLLVGGPFVAATRAFDECGVEVIAIPEVWEGADGAIHPTGEDEVAIYQLTSGSTGDPKAVAISYRNLYANGVAMQNASQGGPADDVMVSWLPLSHDMGMIGFLVTPMAYGIETVSVAPTEFLKSPLNWLQLITDHRGTITAAPNFAYSIVQRRLSRIPDNEFDLSTLRFALCGAEPIDADTMRSFAAAAGRFGFTEGAIVAAYGMAEATLGVSFAPLGVGLAIDEYDTDDSDGPVPPAEPRGSHARREVVLLGPPLLGMHARVVDQSGDIVSPRTIGEFHIRGDAVTDHYLTASGPIPATDADGWLHTGDLGYLTEAGEIAVCGRLKNVIIVAGRNVYPSDVERLAESVNGVRRGGVIAFGVRRDNGPEEIRVVVEAAESSPAADREIRRGIAKKVMSAIGLSPTVIVCPKGTIPKTPSGKLNHVKARVLFSEAAA